MENQLQDFYKKIAKPIFFQLDPEFVHTTIVKTAELVGKFPVKPKVDVETSLVQKIAGIDFKSPIGLAAGFDYEARLTQVLPSFGFGFETIGTITNLAYEGNPKPRLGRLPKSKSLMVNKGFKNQGAKVVAAKLSGQNFQIPVGISIGRTNSLKLKTQKQSIEDIIKAFEIFENSKVANSYYELNISCPNLLTEDIEFYSSKNLSELLTSIDKLKLKKPVFVKMPINKSDKDILLMLEQISKYNFKGVIFGNLLKDRSDSSLYPDEVNKFKKGNFSGKPTQKRSNELIKLAFKHFGKKLVIIGCGGVFSAEDAYKKIKLGASLVQLITGLIYEGPFLVKEINKELVEFLKKDGFGSISQAVGVEN